jgi:hypothetical protein
MTKKEAAFVLFVISAVLAAFWWINIRPLTSVRYMRQRGLERIASVETRITPEKLQTWALREITNESKTVTLPPELASLPRAFVTKYGSGENKFVAILFSGGFEQESLLIGATNAQCHDCFIKIEWRPGIFYCLDR